MAKFCGYCGSRLDIDTGLCPNCNKEQLQKRRIEAPEDQPERDDNVPRMRSAKAARNTSQSHTESRPGRRGRALAVGLILLVVGAIVCGGGFLFLHNRDSETPLSAELTADTIAELTERITDMVSTDTPVVGAGNLENIPIEAAITDEGAAIIPLMDGNCVMITDDAAAVKYAAITADRKHVVVLLDDGILYVTDKAQSYRHVLAEGVRFIYGGGNDGIRSIDGVRNEGVFYLGKNGTCYRVTFIDGATWKLPYDYTVAPNSIYTGYRDHDYYTIGGDDVTATRIDDAEALDVLSGVDGITDDGAVVIWRQFDWGNSDESTLTYVEEGEITTLNGSYLNWMYSKDQQLIVLFRILEDGDNALILKYRGKEFVEIPLEGKLTEGASVGTFRSSIYCDSGALADANADQVSAIYLAAEMEDDESQGVVLYRATTDGSCESLLTDILAYNIANNRIVYSDIDANMYVADLVDGELENSRQIASDSVGFLSMNGEYLYYCANVSEEPMLTCMRLGEEESGGQEIAALDTWDLEDLRLSEDGATVVFTDDDHHLWIWSDGDNAPRSIDERVATDSITSGLEHQIVDPCSFAYRQALRGDDEYGSWRYYNGTTTVELGENTAVEASTGSDLRADEEEAWERRANAVRDDHVSLDGVISEEGTAYIPLRYGNRKTIEDSNVRDAMITADQAHTVVITESDNLYVGVGLDGEYEHISGGVNFIMTLHNDGLIYRGTDDVNYRLRFEDGSVMTLSDRYACAQNSVSVLCQNDAGDLYLVPADSSTQTLVAQGVDGIPQGITDDGNIAFWSSGENIICYENGTETILDDDAQGGIFYYLQYSKDQQLIIWEMGDYTSDQSMIWMKRTGGEAVTCTLGHAIDEPYDAGLYGEQMSLYTDRGMLSEVNADEVTTLYLIIQNALYGISPDGTSEQLLPDVTQFMVANGRIAYLDSKQQLHIADIENGVISNDRLVADGETIASWQGFWLTYTGEYLYYQAATDGEEDVYQLYCCRLQDEDPTLIMDNTWVVDLRFSADGSTIIYEDNDARLWYWHYRQEEPTHIADHISILYSGYTHYEIDPDMFWFSQYDSDGLYYYNGQYTTDLMDD